VTVCCTTKLVGHGAANTLFIQASTSPLTNCA
jgi:hypothetical protein